MSSALLMSGGGSVVDLRGRHHPCRLAHLVRLWVLAVSTTAIHNTTRAMMRRYSDSKPGLKKCFYI